MHEVMNTTPFSNVFRRAKVALGNTQPRYNSQVDGIREKYYINSTRNSQETPEWMSRTNNHYMKQKMRGRSLHVHDQSNFMGVKQTYVYEGMPKVENKSGQFQCVSRKRIRSHWEMKNHTFQLQWPKQEQKKQKKPYFQAQKSGFSDSSRSKAPRDFTFYLPKYSIKQSPLHVQKATPLKIGHSTTVDSIRIK